MKEEKKVKIKLLRGVTGLNLKGEPVSYAAGQVVEVDADFAKGLLKEHAVPVKEETKRDTSAKQPKKETRNG